MKKAILLLLLAPTLFPAYAQLSSLYDTFQKTISVTGSAEMYIIPDEIYVEIELKEYRKKGEEKVELEKIKTNFLSKCKQVAIPDSIISIVSYGGDNANMLYWKKKKKDPDLYGEIIYQIKFSNSQKMDELIEILDDDATTKFQVVRTSHTKIQEYRKQLKIDAIKAAKTKAIYLTEAINEKIGEAITIQEPTESDVTYPSQTYGVNTLSLSNSYSFSRDESKNEETNVSVNFKEIKLRFEVSVLFALK